MDMVYGVDASDKESIMSCGLSRLDSWNDLLPEVPLYSNIYYTVFIDSLKGYEQNPIWGFENAIIYSWMVEE